MKARPDGPTALDLVEEATHLVRCVPAAAGAAYVLGVVPFLLAGTFFVADMSRGAYAARHLPGAALGLVVVFAWMKAWQAVAAEHALAFLEQRVPARLGVAGFWRLLVRQFAVHGPGLLVLPLASVLALPGGWVYAYFQSFTVVGVQAGERAHKAALEQARLWPAQNHAALGAIAVLGILVMVNVAVAVYVVPWLIRTMTGTEHVFAQSGWNPFNTTFLAAVCALAFLVLDPVLKAFYVLRCFYGISRRTGVDLLVQVRSGLTRGATVAVILVAVGVVGLSPVDAQEVSTDTPVEAAGSEAVSAQALDAALDRVLVKPDYVWRDPSTTRPEGALADFAKWVDDLSDRFARWWRDLFDREDDDERGSFGGGGLFGASATLIWWMLVLAAVVIIVLVISMILKRSAPETGVAPAAVNVARLPALDGDDVTADQLEEEEWMRLARELIARGDVRLGLRALFLGSLAGLAGRGLLVLARHKSNRDYERELMRRGAPLGGLVMAFVDNRREFEGVWYGANRPDPEVIARFEQNVRLLVRRDAA